MKFLPDYMEDAQTELFNETGAFFAFSTKQFYESKKGGVRYVSLGAGLVCPEDNAQKLIDGLDRIIEAAIKQDLAENGKTAIIRRELFNHEAGYTMCIDDTVDYLEAYGITRAEVAAVFSAIRDQS